MTTSKAADAGTWTGPQVREAIDTRTPMSSPAVEEVVAPEVPSRSRLPERLRDYLPTALRRMRDRSTGREKPVPLPSGWTQLSAHLGGGLWPGLHVLVGNTGSGKSQWALQLAYEAARQGTFACYVGLELDALGITARLATLGLREQGDTGAAWSHLYLGLDSVRLNKIESTVTEVLARLPIHLEFAGPYGWHYGEMRSVAEGLRGEYPNAEDGIRPGLLVLDFLQVVGGDDRDDLRRRVQMAAYAGRAVARDLDMAVLLVSSTARENYSRLAGGSAEGQSEPFGRGSPGRFVGLGKESGEIEFAADTVLVLGKEDGQEVSGSSTRMCLAVAKLRARAPRAPSEGWVPFEFDGSCFAERKMSQVFPAAPAKSAMQWLDEEENQ